MGAIGPRLALIVVGLAVVWTAAGWALLGRMAARHEARVAETVEAAGAALRGAQDVLLREARLLARDPAVIEGVVRGDWATLARGASPRMISLTVERVADLLLILDAGGAPLVQVPATPRVAGLDVTPPLAPLSLVRPLGGPVYLLGVAPVLSAADVPVGVIVVGRRLERLAAGLNDVGGRPALVAVGGDRALGATRPDLPSAGWESATRAGVVQIGGEPWRLRPVGSGGGLWAAVGVAEDERARRRLWTVLLGSFALAAGAAGGIAWVIRRTMPVGAPPAARAAEVLAALARLAGNEKDLARSLGEALDVVGAVAGASGGIMFRAAAATRTLVPVAHRGVPAERPELARAWPLDGSGLAEAVGDGQLVVVDLQSPAGADTRLGGFARAAGYRTILALPVAAGGPAWGVMVLLFTADARPTSGETPLLEALARQVGFAVERAALLREARETSRRLEGLARLTQTLTATLTLDDVLQRVVDVTVELSGASVSRLWLLDEDGEHLSLRAAGGVRAEVEGIRRLRVGEGLAGAVVASRAPLTVLDALEDPRTRNVEWIRAEGAVSFAGAPLSIGDRPLGALWIATRERHQYTSEEIDLLQSLAGHAAIAIHNARLFGEEQARREQLATLLEINKKIGAAESIDTLLTTIAEEAARLIGVDNATFRIVEGDDAVLAAVVGTAREAGFQPRLKVGESFTGRVIAEGRALMGTLDEVPRVIEAHRGLDERCGYVAYLGVPLRLGERTLGALGFRSRRRFTPGDRELAEAFAGQAAIALEHARLYQEASRQAQRMAALADVERLLSETLDPAVVAQRIADSVCSLLAAASSVLYRVEPESGALVAVTVSSSSATHWLPRLPSGLGLPGLAVTERRPLVSTDTLNDPRVRFSAEQRQRLAATSDHAILAVPIVVRDQVFGALGVRDLTGRVFTGEEIRLAQMFADQAALALENARLHEETERRRREAEELARLARTLTESLDVAAVGERIVESVLAQFGGGASGLWLLQPDGSLRSIIFGGAARAHFKAGSVLPPGTGIAGRAATERRSVWTADILNDPGVVLSDELRGSVEAAGHHAVLAVPLRAKGLVIGVLTLTDRVVRTFSVSEVALLQAFADQAALALENARLHEETERRRREAEVVAEVAGTINASLDLDIVLQRVVEGARDVCRSDTARIALREPGPDHCRFRYSVGMLFQPLEGLTVEPGKGSGGLVLVTGRPFRTDNYFEDPRITKDYVAYVRAEAHVVEMVVPIRIGDHIEGLLYVDNRAPRPFTDGEEASLVRLADHAAVAIDHARVYGEAQARLRETETLLEVSRTLGSTLDFDALLRQFMRQIAAALEADSVAIWTLDESGEWLLPTAGYHIPPERLEPGRGLRLSILRDPLYAEAARTGRPVFTADAGADERIPRFVTEAVPHQSQLFAPVLVKDRMIGGFFAMWWTAAREFPPRELALVEAVASQAGVAIENARLFQENRRRVEELAAAQDQLVRTEKLRALGEMASGVAHDFNNLLAAILGRSQLLLKHIEDPKLRQWLQVIERSATDGAQTVRRLQEFARVRRDQPHVPVDLNEIVRDALEITQSRWREESLRRGIAIELGTQLGALPPVAGDPVELREAMTNLILNAVDAMPAGGTLTLATAVVAEGVEIAVSDTGVGIPERLRDKIFDPFFTTKGPQGTGLGLSMTYGILSRHGARITVESEEGRGSTFRLVFPPAKARESMERKAAVAPAPTGLRCLVVDDEEEVATVIGDVLETAGHRAVVVTDGAAAIERFRSEPFDVVFTDLAMPGVTGWEVAKAVKTQAPHVPVIVVTGFAAELSAEERRAHGVDDVFAKPVKIDDILDAVARVAQRRNEPDGREAS